MWPLSDITQISLSGFPPPDQIRKYLLSLPFPPPNTLIGAIEGPNTCPTYLYLISHTPTPPLPTPLWMKR